MKTFKKCCKNYLDFIYVKFYLDVIGRLIRIRTRQRKSALTFGFISATLTADIKVIDILSIHFETHLELHF